MEVSAIFGSNLIYNQINEPSIISYTENERKKKGDGLGYAKEKLKEQERRETSIYCTDSLRDILTFESDKPLEEFKAELDKKISGYNVVSAANTQACGNNMLVVRSVEETAEGYRVEIAFRRIDKIAVNGRFEYKKLSSYLKDYIVNPDPEGQDPTETDAVNYRSQTLVKWAKGDLTGISVDGLDKLLSFKDKTELELKAVPKTVSGETMEIDDFIEEGKKAGNRETILTFYTGN